ncbi:unnamed protein product [Adineta ricciae]|uniref:NAD(P)(+)--arginine ADP-ribosyltransferase n=1 Tax=Adineta ricciae TaxID=249248 RepID=A0A816D5P9_ADIRI|nr:unnamed protein product [Adineta ricciae]
MDDKQSAIIDKDSNVQKAALSSRRRRVDDYYLLWMDTMIDESNKDHQSVLEQLHSFINDIEICTNEQKCMEFINENDDRKIFLIISECLAQHLLSEIHEKSQVIGIYLLSHNRSNDEELMKKWNKIQRLYTSTTSICKMLQPVVKQYDHNSVNMSYIPENENLNQLEANFMYTQLFKEILLEIEYDEYSIKRLATYWRELFADSKVKLNLIDEFDRLYCSEKAIEWYTRDCFIYRMLNQSLRKFDSENMINMSFFLRDIHMQIQELHRKQVNSYNGQRFFVYRGQGFSKVDFEKLLKTKGGLISFNSFLSTSRDPEVARPFANGAIVGTDTVGVFFRMSIDPTIVSTPFASIQEVSGFPEEEILFSMHAVFRVQEIKESNHENPLYEVELELTSDDNDEQLHTLTQYMRNRTRAPTGWRRLATFLIEIDQLEEAGKMYALLLVLRSNDSEKAFYCNQLGTIKDKQGDYEAALWCYEEALTTTEKILPLNYEFLATCYNNIGAVYENMKDYSQALSLYTKSNEILQRILPENHRNMAASYNNIGNAHHHMGEYSKACLFLDKALEILQKSLPSNHPLIGTAFTNSSYIYYVMEDYSKALSYLEQARDICTRSLPPGHIRFRTIERRLEAIKQKLENQI